MGKLCRAFQKLPGELEKEDLQQLYAVLDSLAYDDAWTQFTDIDGFDKLSESQTELIADVRYRMQDLDPKNKDRE